MILCILSVILDLAIYKWRNLVHYCVVVDLLFFNLYQMIPNLDLSGSLFQIAAIHAVNNVGYGSGPAWQIFVTILSILFHIFFTLGFVYQRSELYTLSGFSEVALLALSYFVGYCMIVIMIEYVIR